MNLRNCPLLLRLLIYGPVYSLQFIKFLFKDSFKIDKVKLSYPKDTPTYFVAPIPEDLAQWLEEKLGLNRSQVDEMIKEKVKLFLA